MHWDGRNFGNISVKDTLRKAVSMPCPLKEQDCHFNITYVYYNHMQFYPFFFLQFYSYVFKSKYSLAFPFKIMEIMEQYV